MFLIGSIVRTTLLDCVDMFVLSLGICRSVQCPRVGFHCSHLVQPASLPHMQTREFFILEGSIEESLEYVFWEAWISLQLFFTLPATNSENFDSCSTSVSSHCMTATWSSFTFLVRFGDMSLAIDAACSTTDLGLNQCVTANRA